MATTLRIEVAPLSPEQKQEEAMAAICCEWYEQAIAAGMITLSRFGQPYLTQGVRRWAFTYCPFCAARAAEAHVAVAPASACTRDDIIAAVANNPTTADAAKALGISRATFYYRLRKHGLQHLIGA